MNFNLLVHAFNLLDLSEFHSILPEPFFPSVPDIGNLFHRLDGLNVHVPVVLDGFVAFLLKLEDGIVG